MDETLAMEKVKIFRTAKWTLFQDTHVWKINMGIVEDPKYIPQLNGDLEGKIVVATKDLLWKFINVFVWNYKKLERIPYSHIAKHKIEFNCQGHKDPQEQRLKERSKSNFQTRNKTRLCD
jgi:hypothetical protein